MTDLKEKEGRGFRQGTRNLIASHNPELLDQMQGWIIKDGVDFRRIEGLLEYVEVREHIVDEDVLIYLAQVNDPLGLGPNNNSDLEPFDSAVVRTRHQYRGRMVEGVGYLKVHGIDMTVRSFEDLRRVAETIDLNLVNEGDYDPFSRPPKSQ